MDKIEFDTLSLKVSTEYNIFTAKWVNEKLIEDLILSIDKCGDKHDKKTNVKALMTDWQMWKTNEPCWKAVADQVINICKTLRPKGFYENMTPCLTDMWGAMYLSEEKTIPHDHWPSTWSFCWYLNKPEDSPDLYFPEADYTLPVTKGTMVFFPGWLRHEVKSKPFKNKRYMIAGNVRLLP